MTKHTPTPLQPQLPFDEIPYGYCHCGCDQLAPIAKHSSNQRGWVKGEPIRFIKTHTYPATKRFWANVDKRGPDECWEWRAGVTDNGYGHISVNYHKTYAHRFSFELHYGPIPKGICVCHKCDNPPCVNPEHLFLGTDKDNADDRDAKGRDIRPRVLFGSKHPSSKLTEEQVRAARQRHAQGESNASLARAFGVVESTMRFILNRTTWRHLE